MLPMDGATLAEVMRQRGINMRYLGKVLDLVLRSPAREQLDHIFVSGVRGLGRVGYWGWRQGLTGTCPLSRLPENRHRRAHHPICQAYLQDVLAGRLPWARRGPGVGLTDLSDLAAHPPGRVWSSQAFQLPSATS